MCAFNVIKPLFSYALCSILVFNFFVRPRLQITSVVVCNYSTRLIDDGSQQP